MSTQVYYNGIVLHDCETLRFDQSVEYDSSNTDELFSRFLIRVSSILTCYDNPHHDSTIETVDTGNVVLQERDIQQRLSEPRKDFKYLIRSAVTSDTGGSLVDAVLVQATGYVDGTWDVAAPGGVAVLANRLPYADPNNGPKPKSVQVTSIFGGRAMRVVFEIEVCQVRNMASFSDPTIVPDVVEADARILSNRWSLTESKDENWYTTKVLQGTLRVRHSSYWPHAMRYLCVPPLLTGYRRIRQEFVGDPTDLVLKYRIEDRQQHAAAPWPIVNWSGTHSEVTSGNGVTQTGSVHLRVTGPPNVDKRWLIGRAGAIVVSRLVGVVKTEVSPDYETVLKELAIIDHMHDSTIEMRAAVRYVTDEYKWLGMRVNSMGLPLDEMLTTIDGYSPRSNPIPLPYDSLTPAGIFSCYLQHPQSVWHDVPGALAPGSVETQHSDKIKDGDSESQAYEYPEGEPLIETPSVMSTTADLYTYPITVYNISTRYIINKGHVQLPLARQPAAPTDDTCVIVRTHGGVCKRILTIEAMRSGKWPTLPSLAETLVDENGITETLEDIEIDNSAPQIEADRTSRNFAIRAKCTYLLSRPPSAAERLRSGSIPMDSTAPDANSVPLSEVVDTLGHIQWEPSV